MLKKTFNLFDFSCLFNCVCVFFLFKYFVMKNFIELFSLFIGPSSVNEHLFRVFLKFLRFTMINYFSILN